MLISYIDCTLYKAAIDITHCYLIYCHSHSGNKLEGKKLLLNLVNHFSIVLFDSSGCGNSSGKYCTLGLDEAKDIPNIIKALHYKFNANQIYLWGRSIGAVAIMHTMYNVSVAKETIKDNDQRINKLIEQYKHKGKDYAKYKRKIEKLQIEIEELVKLVKLESLIKGIILDSPFPYAKTFVTNLLKSHLKANTFTTSIILLYMKNTLKLKIGKDIITDNDPINIAEFINVPAIFLIGDNDTLIERDSFIDLFNTYNSDCKKLRLLLDSDHSSERCIEDIDSIIKFLGDVQNDILQPISNIDKDDNSGKLNDKKSQVTDQISMDKNILVNNNKTTEPVDLRILQSDNDPRYEYDK